MQTEGEEKSFSLSSVRYENLWKAIIRPPRDDYQPEELGNKMFYIMGKKYHRIDYDIVGENTNILKGSLIEPIDSDKSSNSMPVVIYLHGNSSSRVEGIRYVNDLLKRGINLFVFDFAGCGKSEGEYVSLGYNEAKDLRIIVNFLQKLPSVGKIGIWGRSMGASTGLIYAHTDPRISCVCLDSPFANFISLAKEVCNRQIKLPDAILNTAIILIKNTIIEKNGLDLTKLNPIEDAEKTYCPIFFIHALDDDLIQLEHSIELFEKCPSKDKKLNVCEGNHNTVRQNSVIDKICNFFQIYLK